jgi:hypothetical protein
MLPLLVKEGKGGKRHIGFDCEVINQQNYLKFAEGTSIYVLSIFALENLGWFSNENPILSYFPTLSFNQL